MSVQGRGFDRFIKGGNSLDWFQQLRRSNSIPFPKRKENLSMHLKPSYSTVSGVLSDTLQEYSKSEQEDIIEKALSAIESAGNCDSAEQLAEKIASKLRDDFKEQTNDICESLSKAMFDYNENPREEEQESNLYRNKFYSDESSNSDEDDEKDDRRRRNRRLNSKNSYQQSDVQSDENHSDAESRKQQRKSSMNSYNNNNNRRQTGEDGTALSNFPASFEGSSRFVAGQQNSSSSSSNQHRQNNWNSRNNNNGRDSHRDNNNNNNNNNNNSNSSSSVNNNNGNNSQNSQQNRLPAPLPSFMTMGMMSNAAGMMNNQPGMYNGFPPIFGMLPQPTLPLGPPGMFQRTTAPPPHPKFNGPANPTIMSGPSATAVVAQPSCQIFIFYIPQNLNNVTKLSQFFSSRYGSVSSYDKLDETTAAIKFEKPEFAKKAVESTLKPFKVDQIVVTFTRSPAPPKPKPTNRPQTLEGYEPNKQKYIQPADQEHKSNQNTDQSPNSKLDSNSVNTSASKPKLAGASGFELKKRQKQFEESKRLLQLSLADKVKVMISVKKRESNVNDPTRIEAQRGIDSIKRIKEEILRAQNVEDLQVIEKDQLIANHLFDYSISLVLDEMPSQQGLAELRQQLSEYGNLEAIKHPDTEGKPLDINFLDFESAEKAYYALVKSNNIKFKYDHILILTKNPYQEEEDEQQVQGTVGSEEIANANQLQQEDQLNLEQPAATEAETDTITVPKAADTTNVNATEQEAEEEEEMYAGSYEDDMV